MSLVNKHADKVFLKNFKQHLKRQTSTKAKALEIRQSSNNFWYFFDIMSNLALNCQ